MQLLLLFFFFFFFSFFFFRLLIVVVIINTCLCLFQISELDISTLPMERSMAVEGPEGFAAEAWARFDLHLGVHNTRILTGKRWVGAHLPIYSCMYAASTSTYLPNTSISGC
ncbi:hypothetical protein F5X96DRAFT_658944, partial [Biscogniauxia mediterranea]